MQIATRPATTAPAADAISWLLLETRGPVRNAGEGWTLSNLRFDVNEAALATLVDGRMNFPEDRGVAESMFQSLPDLERDGVDPDAARQAVREGVALLTSAVDRATQDLAAFAVTPGVWLPRDADTYEIWLRRESGARARYIVPYAQVPASLRDAQAAQRQLETTLRSSYVELDPPDGWGIAQS